jgi:hypothetical protein
MFYPLIPLLAQFFNIVGEIDYSIGHVNRWWMLYASYIGTSIQGFLTTLLFLTIDPAWIQLRQDLYRQFFPDNVFENEDITLSGISGATPDIAISNYV